MRPLIFGAFLLLSAELCAVSSVCEAQIADQAAPLRDAEINQAENQVVDKGVQEADALWDAGKAPLERQVKKDLNAIESDFVRPTPTIDPGDTIPDIQREINQLEDEN